MNPPADLDDGAAAEVLAEGFGVDGSGHEDDPDVREGVHHVLEDDEEEVGLVRSDNEVVLFDVVHYYLFVFHLYFSLIF